LDKTETVSIVDGVEQAWWEFAAPVYAISGDQINVTVDDQYSRFGIRNGVQKISWEINRSMVLVGVRLDGWLIQTEDGEHVSVLFDSVTRSDEER